MNTKMISLGIPVNNQSQFWMQKRVESGALAGFWEFPGGKAERGESELAAMVRELREEVEAKDLSYLNLGIYRHEYKDRSVILNSFLVQAKFNESLGQWFSISDESINIMPGNLEIMKDLKQAIEQGITWNQFIKF